MKRTFAIIAGLSVFATTSAAFAWHPAQNARTQLRIEARNLAQRSQGLLRHLRFDARRLNRYSLDGALLGRFAESAQRFARISFRGHVRQIDEGFRELNARFEQAQRALTHRHTFVARARFSEIEGSMAAIGSIVQQLAASIYTRSAPSYSVTYTPYTEPAPAPTTVYTTPGAHVSWYQQ